MLLKVGELTRQTGLTVRTLHHYDAIGLLQPSARSAAGYRLYQLEDVVRLHQIQALRRLGLSLARIGVALAQPEGQLLPIIERQLQALDEQLQQTRMLREHLQRLHAHLRRGERPEIGELLHTLEAMSMYEQYFMPDELKQLPFGNGTSRAVEWSARVEQVRSSMQAGVAAESAEAQQLARRWMTMLAEDLAASPELLARLNTIHQQNRLIQERTGVSPQLMHYLQQALTATKMAIYARYLSADELAFLKVNYPKRLEEWPPIVAALRRHMAQRDPASSPAAVQALARQWRDLFRSYAGDDPTTQQKIRDALAQEPELKLGSFIDEPLLVYVREAMLALRAP